MRSLSTDWQSVDEVKAQLIIESSMDAIEAFGGTHQEEKVELRRAIEKAEIIVSPDSIDSLKKRAEKFVLRFLYPRNPIIRNTLFVLIAFIAVLGIVFTIKKALMEQATPQRLATAPSPTPTASSASSPGIEFIPIDEKEALVKSFKVKGFGNAVRLKFVAKNLDLDFDFDAPIDTNHTLLLQQILDHFSFREHVKVDPHALPTGVKGGVWYPDWKLVVKGKEIEDRAKSL